MDDCDLKRYQDLFMLKFIQQEIPSGSKILEVGGGDSRILRHLSGKYECWNIDKFAGNGNGPTQVPQVDYRIVVDYMGSFNEELPDGYFDLVFSISALEHLPWGDAKIYNNVINDINRVLKIGCYSLHLMDFVLGVSENPFFKFIFNNQKCLNRYMSYECMFNDQDIYYMSENVYNKSWIHITKKSYAQFGKPSSYNILWVK